MPASRMPAFIALSVGAVLLAFCPAPAEAALILTVNSSTAQAGGTGSFDVILSSSSGTFGVSGFSVELSVSAGSGVRFTGATTATTTAPYIFGTLQSPPLTFSTFPTTGFIASDSDAIAPGFVNVTPASPFGLEHVTYSVAPGTVAGPITVSIVGLSGLGATTEINDVTGAPIAFTPVNGTITVSATVPEPSSLCLTAAMTGSSLLLIARRAAGRRRAGVQ